MTKKRKIETVPLYRFEDTSDEKIKRVVDRWGDWKYYWLVDKKKFVPAVNHILHTSFPKGQRFTDYLLRSTKEEAKKVLEEAGERGSRVHQAISELLKGITVTQERVYLNELTGRQERLTPDEWDMLLAFERFAIEWKIELQNQEQAVATSEYAGTYDFLGFITDPKTGVRVQALLDWKTSSAIYPEYAAQVAAYARATFGQMPFTGILRVGSRHKNGYEFKLWNPTETVNNYNQGFAPALAIFRHLEGEYEHDEREVPTSITLRLKKAKIKRVKKQKNVVS